MHTGPLVWSFANGMWFAKTRGGRYRIRPEAGGFIVSHRNALASSSAQEHADRN